MEDFYGRMAFPGPRASIVEVRPWPSSRPQPLNMPYKRRGNVSMELAYGDSMLYLRPVGLNRIRGIHLKRKSEAMQHSFTGT